MEVELLEIFIVFYFISFLYFYYFFIFPFCNSLLLFFSSYYLNFINLFKPTILLYLAQLAGALEDIDCFSAEGWDSPIECPVAQLAGAVEYTDCSSAEGWDSPNECPDYDTKQSDGEVPVMFGLVSLFNGISTFVGYLMPKLFSKKNSSGTI